MVNKIEVVLFLWDFLRENVASLFFQYLKAFPLSSYALISRGDKLPEYPALFEA